MFFETKSKNQTKKLAKLLCQTVLRKKNPSNALVFALSGDLGAGKTTFVQGFISGAGIKKRVISPTFVLIKTYKLKNLKTYKLIHHIDCYRIKKAKELLSLGLKEILKDPKNIVLIEWPEIIKKYLPAGKAGLPKNIIQIKFEHGEKINERIISFKLK